MKLQHVEEMILPLVSGDGAMVSAFAEGRPVEALRLVTAFITEAKGTIWFLGNGGSAATAQHVALDATNVGLRAASLPNVAVLTANANDHGYRRALWKYLSVYLQEGDRVVLISVSGASPNVVYVESQCRRRNAPVLAMVGFAGTGALKLAANRVVVESDNFALVEYVHLGLLVAALERLRQVKPCASAS